jgi:hypothetical protein
MTMKRAQLVSSVIAALVLASTPALSLSGSYGPLGVDQGSGQSELIKKIHGCHRSCEWGPGLGWWHRHTGYACRAIACDSRRPPGFWDEPGYRRYPFVYRYRNGCRITPWGEVFCRF